jgi:hypothetical protein
MIAQWFNGQYSGWTVERVGTDAGDKNRCTRGITGGAIRCLMARRILVKPRLVTVFLSISLASATQLWATTLPDACGDDKVKFDVSTQKGQPAPDAPDAGKAQIVFIENENRMIGPFMYATVRFGLDGAWAGANSNNSYFAVTVDPGVHHLCASWQSVLPMLKKSIDVASFTAEPGKVYYFAADVAVIPVGDNNANYAFALSQLDDDRGQYRVKAWKLAASTPR